MENKFYTDDDFEHFLKDTTDNFRMYPSKKVWYSIYNDLHPSRKWPSLAVCLVLVSAILFVGVSNNNSINKSNKNNTANTLFINEGISAPAGTGTLAVNPAFSTTTILLKNSAPGHVDDYSGETKTIAANPDKLISTDNYLSSETGAAVASNGAPVKPGIPSAGTDRHNQESIAAMLNSADKNDIVSAEALLLSATDKNSAADTEDNDEFASAKDNIVSAPVSITAASPTKQLTQKGSFNYEINTEDKAWIENFAYNNKAAISRFKANAAIEYYVAPSIGFRFLKKNNNFEPPFRAGQQGLISSNNVSTLSVDDEVTQKSAINMEAGVALLYNISKKVRLKTGIQLNYTSYISFADALKHPTQSSLLLNDGNGSYTMVPRLSTYANSINGDKNEKLNNKTVQLSLPIGADIKLAGKSNLKWYAGGTIQPSLITGGQVFALSADTKNYVEEPSLLRKWNVSAGVETFISYKTPSGIIVNAGPQLRYQFLSTYTKQYSYTEKLYNIGVKLGITKNF